MSAGGHGRPLADVIWGHIRNSPDQIATFKTIGDREVKVHIHNPSPRSQPSAAILFFHGGAFIKGHPAQSKHEDVKQLKAEMK